MAKPAPETIPEAYLVESVRWRVLGLFFHNYQFMKPTDQGR